MVHSKVRGRGVLKRRGIHTLPHGPSSSGIIIDTPVSTSPRKKRTYVVYTGGNYREGHTVRH